MLKRTILIAAAIAAIASAGPAAASAAWTDGTVNVGDNRNVTSTGTFAFAGGLGSITCPASTGMTLMPGTTAAFTSLSVEGPPPVVCTTGGLLAGCKVTSITSTNLPWTSHTNGSQIAVTDLDADYTLHGAFCPYHIIRLTGSFLIVPSNQHAMSSGSLSGTAATSNGTTGAAIQNVSVGGSHSFSPAGTYGLT